MIKEKTPKVVQAHALVKGDYRAFSAIEMKIFKVIASKVNSNRKETLFRDSYFLKKSELLDIGVKKNNLYDVTTKALKKLALIYIKLEDKKTIKEIGLIRNEFTYHKQEGLFEFIISNDLAPYLIGLNSKNPFSSYAITNLKMLKKKEELKLFELLNKNKEFEMRIESLVKVMELKGSYTKRFALFNQKFKAVINTIEAYTNLKINYRYIKVGRKVNSIYFKIDKVNQELVTEQLNTKRLHETQLKLFENTTLKNGWLMLNIDVLEISFKYEDSDEIIHTQKFRTLPEMLQILQAKDN